ncbi:MAG: helix-turn-helix domain-containing protein [Caulobacterales bacterium]
MLQIASMGRKGGGGGQNYLLAWREKRGLTQAQLAEKVGTTGAVISLLESGGRPLSDKWLRRIAPVLDIRPGWLYDVHPDENASDDIFQIWPQIPPADRAHVLEIVRTFASKRASGRGS